MLPLLAQVQSPPVCDRERDEGNARQGGAAADGHQDVKPATGDYAI
jgi:hypothetical protein